jgi:ribonuclease D
MPTQNTNPSLPLLIKSQAHLDEVCANLSGCAQVAVDTEFVRTNTYAPRLGLLQLTTPGMTVCIDPLAGMEMSPLWELLFEPQRTSIMHSAKQDLEVMWFERHEIIHNLVDTQLCAALLGYPAQIGYAGLLNELLGIEIGKTQTRTDWSRRPLSDAQLEYAAEDVVHLPEMLDILAERLHAVGRYDWALEDSRALCQVELYKPEPADAWQRLKAIPFMSPEQQTRARALAAWREARAVAADKPRGWILSDKALLQLATENPNQTNQLQKIDDMPAAIIRKQGDKLLNVLAAANDSFARGDSEFTKEIVDIEREKSLSKRMTTLVKEEAEKLGIAAEVLASKRDINAVIRGSADARVLNGWRRAVIGDKLLAATG